MIHELLILHRSVLGGGTSVSALTTYLHGYSRFSGVLPICGSMYSELVVRLRSGNRRKFDGLKYHYLKLSWRANRSLNAVLGLRMDMGSFLARSTPPLFLDSPTVLQWKSV